MGRYLAAVISITVTRIFSPNKKIKTLVLDTLKSKPKILKITNAPQNQGSVDPGANHPFPGPV